MSSDIFLSSSWLFRGHVFCLLVCSVSSDIFLSSCWLFRGHVFSLLVCNVSSDILLSSCLLFSGHVIVCLFAMCRLIFIFFSLLVGCSEDYMSSLKSQYKHPSSASASSGGGHKRSLLNALESTEVG